MRHQKKRPNPAPATPTVTHPANGSPGVISPQLSHLILIPQSGICNRLRTIAAARRLCRQLKVKCSVVWTWGSFENYFVKTKDFEVVNAVPAHNGKQMRHHPWHVDTNRTVDVEVESLELKSGYVFWGTHESKEVTLAEVKKYIPKLAPPLMRIVNDFSRRHFKNTVGFHMRRTDNSKCIQNSPDNLFIEKAREVISQGKKIFLATDNRRTEAQMTDLFGDAIIIYPKRKLMNSRWPRFFDPMAMEDDVIDLFLLTKTEYMVGGYWSAFSGVAAVLNGSKKCEILRLPEIAVA